MIVHKEIWRPPFDPGQVLHHSLSPVHLRVRLRVRFRPPPVQVLPGWAAPVAPVYDTLHVQHGHDLEHEARSAEGIVMSHTKLRFLVCVFRRSHHD